MEKNNPQINLLFISAHASDIIAKLSLLEEGGFSLHMLFTFMTLLKKVIILHGLEDNR